MTEAAAHEPAAKPKKEKLTDEQKAAKKLEREQAAAQKKADAEAAREAKKNAPALAKDTKNGVTRPARGVTLTVWQTADTLSAEKKAPTDRKSVVDALSGKVEVGTIHTQYGRWRKYYGLTETKDERRARHDATKVKKQEVAAAKKAERAIEKQKKADEKAAAAAQKKADAEAKAASVEAAKQAEQAPATV